MQNYTLHRGRLIDHIQLVTNNFEASKAFYTFVLAVLEKPVVITDENYMWADELVISSVKSSESAGVPTGRYHLAFQAMDREMVDTFYHVALTHGGSDNGPGIAPEWQMKRELLSPAYTTRWAELPVARLR